MIKWVRNQGRFRFKGRYAVVVRDTIKSRVLSKGDTIFPTSENLVKSSFQDSPCREDAEWLHWGNLFSALRYFLSEHIEQYPDGIPVGEWWESLRGSALTGWVSVAGVLIPNCLCMEIESQLSFRKNDWSKHTHVTHLVRHWCHTSLTSCWSWHWSRTLSLEYTSKWEHRILTKLGLHSWDKESKFLSLTGLLRVSSYTCSTVKG